MQSTDWPLFSLRLRTPRLELRLPTDDDLGELVQRIREGMLNDDEPYPFAGPWALEPEPKRTWGALQANWRARSNFSADEFDLPFITVADGAIVGVQDVGAKQFSRLREVSSGSWVASAWQGQGIGREMRAAMLTFAFEALGAAYALSAARVSNSRSIAVSRSLGYRENGMTRHGFGAAETDEQYGFRIDRDEWLARTDRPDVRIDGWDVCAPMFEPTDIEPG